MTKLDFVDILTQRAALDDGFRFMPSGLMITPNSVSNRLEYTREMIKYDDHEDVEDWPEIRL